MDRQSWEMGGKCVVGDATLAAIRQEGELVVVANRHRLPHKMLCEDGSIELGLLLGTVGDMCPACQRSGSWRWTHGISQAPLQGSE